MFNKLNHDQIDQLQQHLIVPLAVADIIEHNLMLEADMQYSLHMALSEIDPDSALLAIALCTKDLARKYMSTIPIAVALSKEADNIIEEYGALWLRHYSQNPMPTEVFEAVLQTVPEDLEAMADLLDALAYELGEHEEATYTLSNLLSIQARAHMEIADFILAEIEFERAEEKQGQETTTVPLDMELIDSDNIILFPGIVARQ
jgi:hypothetical protein